MPVNKRQLDLLNRDYVSWTGKMVQNFVCPITLNDEPSAELCNGHILNEAIGKASRATVVMGKDIDNYFGHKVEAELVEFLNHPFLSKEELFRKSRDLRLTIPGIKPINVIYPSAKNVPEKFPQINLFDRDGKAFSSPFLKTESPIPMQSAKVLIEGSGRFNNFSLLIAFIKSAYLALYRMFGYGWVFSAGGSKVRLALANFYQENPPIDRSLDYFGGFENAYSLVTATMDIDGDTLSHETVMLHFSKGSSLNQGLFGITCFFKIFDRMFLVFLPSFLTFGFDFAAYKKYQSFLKDHSMPHDAYIGHMRDGIIEVMSGPIQIQNPTLTTKANLSSQ